MLKTLVWVNKIEDLERYKIKSLDFSFEVFISDFSKTKFNEVKNNCKKMQCSKIIKIKSDGKFDLIYKRNSAWTSTKFNDLILSYLNINNLKPSSNDVRMPKIIKENKKQLNIEYPFEVNQNFAEYSKILEFYLKENSVNEIWKINNENTIFSFYEKIQLENLDYFESFLKEIRNKSIAGVNELKIIELSNDLLLLENNKSEVYIKKNENLEVEITAVFITDINGEAPLYSYSKGIVTNIINYLKQSTTDGKISKKIKPKDILIWVLSFTVVAILLYTTFNFIFSPHNSKTALEIIFSKYSWSNIWVYLMSINFLISLFIGPLIAMILFKISYPKKKIEMKNYVQFFISGQVRLTVMFITGNAILATIFWGWYMVSVTRIKTVSIVGMVASMSILRGIIMIPLGGLFMIRGTIFEVSILNELGVHSEMAALVSLSWIGWIWHIIHNLSIAMLIFLPPLHIVYNKIILFKYGREQNTEQLTEKMTTFEMNLVQLKYSFKKIFKDRDRFYRVFLFILVNIFIETFEFTYSLRMVEDYAINVAGYSVEKANYWNVFAISGVRFMSGYVHHVPLINMIPGQGAGFTDIALKISTEGVINHAHINDVNFNLDIANSLGEQTSFMMRFYNFYLRRMIALVISTAFVTIALFRKRAK